MSDKWPRDLWLDAIWEDEALKPNDRVVAYVYARYAFENDTAWTSWAEIMRRSGMRSKRSVSAAIKALVDGGWLTQVAHARQHRSAIYRLTCPVQRYPSATAGPDDDPFSSSDPVPLEPDEVLPAVANSSPAVADLHSAVAIWPFSGSNTAPQNSKENSEENSNKRSNALRARDPSDARVADYWTEERMAASLGPHQFVEGAEGKCRCGLPRGDDKHSTRKIKSAARRSA